MSPPDSAFSICVCLTCSVKRLHASCLLPYDSEIYYYRDSGLDSIHLCDHHVNHKEYMKVKKNEAAEPLRKAFELADERRRLEVPPSQCPLGKLAAPGGVVLPTATFLLKENQKQLSTFTLQSFLL